MSGNAKITMAPAEPVVLTSYASALSSSDVALVDGVVAADPDVVVIIGHAGDVEEVVERVQNGTTKPKAVIAVMASAPRATTRTRRR
jgi:predicted TIM-barrel fold metal-dependent hydrolase